MKIINACTKCDMWNGSDLVKSKYRGDQNLKFQRLESCSYFHLYQPGGLTADTAVP